MVRGVGGVLLLPASANPPWRHHTGPSDSLTCPKNRLPHSRIRFRPVRLLSRFFLPGDPQIHHGARWFEFGGIGSPRFDILVNWGCQRDLHRVFGLGRPGAGAFVVYNHRPIHLHNLSKGNDSVVVLYTGGDEKLQAGLGYDFEVSESDLCNLDYVDHEVEESEEE
ncbi:hypothetical protein Tsubulata_038999 [Turnera subulata]|uniref:Uncharacterized protein n=1 Tax=Turnera subulata TaxID=218843 RepID=A0A9Q0F1E6_9ROSI|nr:hypothetical protein Tsubulata_038999 [Turnera subulata]